MAATFVIVGGDAAGMSAASKAKRENSELDVVVFEKGEWVSYGACGMPYYVKGDIAELEDLVAITPEEFREERDIDLRTNSEVVGIDREAQTVTVENSGGSYEQEYDDLLIATGARAIEPPIEGLDLDGVFTFHSMESAEEVRDAVAGDAKGSGADGAGEGSEKPESVGIIGAGYIGLEMAEAFEARGLDVSVFEMLPHVLNPFGEPIAEKVEEHLREQGVDLYLDTLVEEIGGETVAGEKDGVAGEKSRVATIETEEKSHAVDAVLVATGVAPNAELAEEAGIELGETGAIATDEFGRTNDPHVFAAGDCAEAHNAVTDAPDYVPLALTANRAGRAIGSTVAGDPTEVGDIVGTAVVKVFDLEVARTGITDHEEAEQAGYEPVSKVITDESRAHYYPDPKPITVEMVGDRETGRLLGAAMVGREGVAKRIDTVATALHAGMTVEEVQNLDLSYAPPFGPTWDPVLTAAKVLSGKLE